jgi:hypothetical protein
MLFSPIFAEKSNYSSKDKKAPLFRDADLVLISLLPQDAS